MDYPTGRMSHTGPNFQQIPKSKESSQRSRIILDHIRQMAIDQGITTNEAFKLVFADYWKPQMADSDKKSIEEIPGKEEQLLALREAWDEDPSNLYVHYKGGIYRALMSAVRVDDGTLRVIYRHLWPFKPETYDRDAKEFHEYTHPDGWAIKVKRFVLVRGRP